MALGLVAYLVAPPIIHTLDDNDGTEDKRDDGLWMNVRPSPAKAP